MAVEMKAAPVRLWCGGLHFTSLYGQAPALSESKCKII